MRFRFLFFVFCALFSLKPLFSNDLISQEIKSHPAPNHFHEPFEKLHVTGPVDVTLKEGREQAFIEVRCPKEIRENLVIDIKNNVAKITYKEDYLNQGPGTRGKRVSLIVSNANLVEIVLKGSGELNSISALHLDTLHLIKQGPGFIDLNLAIKNFKLELDGSCEATLKGSAKKLKLTCQGSSKYLGRNFVTESSDVSLKGTSKSIIHTLKSLKIHISEHAQLRYLGDSKIELKKNQGPCSVLPL